MHECFTVQDWIRAWTALEPDESRLSECCRCAQAGSGAAERLATALGCPECRRTLEAAPGVPCEVVECPRCMAACDELDALLETLEHFDPAVVAESFEVEALYRELAPLPAAEQEARVAAGGRYRRWSLCQRFLAEAQAQWRQDPALAHARAATAVAVAGALDEETYHPRWVADLRAKAHAYLGNSHRILGRFADAERELRCAEAHVRRGVDTGLREARVLSFRASLLIDLDRHDEAERLLARVEDYYRTTGQRTELARTQLKHAAVFAFREAYRAAAEECARAFGNLDLREDSRLASLACQNAAHYLVHAGEVERARSLFSTLPASGERMVLLRRKWLEADLLRAEGRFDLASEAYEGARRDYAAAGLPYDVALISLDQALTAYETGDHERMRELAAEAEGLLAAGGARREALAVLRVLATAIEQRTVTRGVLAAIRKRIADARPSC